MEEIKIAFKYQGTWIENPNLDETGRFPVEPKEYYGDNYIEALHSEARDLMVELDEKYNRDTCMSLDEYFCEYEFTKDEKNRVWELLNKF